MKHHSSPEVSKKKTKAAHKKQTKSRRTINDINDFFRIIPDDDGVFTPEITKTEQKHTNINNTTNDQRKNNLNNFSKNKSKDYVPTPKFLKKTEKENSNDSKTFQKKRDINKCIPATIIQDKKIKEADKVPKVIQEDTRKNLINKHAREDVLDKVVDKENLRKNNRNFRDDDKPIKEDTRKNQNNKHAREEVVGKTNDKENLRKNNRYFRDEDKAIKEDMRKNPNNKHPRDDIVEKILDKDNSRKSTRYIRDEDKAIKEDMRKNPNNKHLRDEIVERVLDKDNSRKNTRYFRDKDKTIKEDMRKNPNYKRTCDEVVDKVTDKETLRKNNKNIRDEDKSIKEDMRKNTNYKHSRDEVVDKVLDKDNSRKNKWYFRLDDIHRNDVRKKFNSIVRDEAKGDIKHNSKLVADVKINISKPMGDILKTNNRKYNRDEKDTENRGGGDFGKQIKGIKPNENKNIDDKRINSNKEVHIVKPPVDIISRKKLINERYTFRMKNGPLKENTTLKENTALKENATLKENTILNENTTSKETTEKCAEEINNDVEKTIDKATPILKSSESSDKSVHTEPKSVGTKPVKKPIKPDSNGQRKPIIKTVRVKNDNRVFKSVTFVDRKQATPLLISIPTVPTHRKPSKKDRELRHPVKHNTSKDSLVRKPKIERDKSAKIKKRSKRRRILSPDLFTKERSPPTEVAQWAPSCMNHHTKPYYEAWVDTTLAATTKYLNSDELSFQRQHFVKAFKTALEKPLSEEIVFDKIGDERYTGKIRVRHR